MRHGSASRRTRNRGNGSRRGNQNRTQVFDSNGPDVRIRGTAHQICEKYIALAKDSAASGDLILAESYLQHAEHYQRLINGWGETSRDTNRAHESEENTENHQAREHSADSVKKQVEKEEDLGLPESLIGKKKQEVLEDA